MHMSWAAWILISILLSLSASAQNVAIPEPLEDWKQWALYNTEYVSCPVVIRGSFGQKQSHVCAYPGRLALTIDQNTALFSQSWIVHVDGYVLLPGGPGSWPQDVKIDGVAQLVNGGEQPKVWLSKGEYQLSGRFEWQRRPEKFAIPSITAMIDLSIDGTMLPYYQRDKQFLWLGARVRVGQSVESDGLEIEVYRKIRDLLPMKLTSEFQFDVSGKPRELSLSGLLPDGFEVTHIESELPIIMEKGGLYKLQLQAGYWSLIIESRAVDHLNKVSLAKRSDSLLPVSEVWVFEAKNSIRNVKVEGVSSIDPSTVGLPGSWDKFPAYLVEPGQSMTLVERTRGIDHQLQNNLNLDREMWLTFSGEEWIAVDTISGSMLRDKRLDLFPGIQFDSAVENGASVLITQMDGRQGMEVMHSELQLELVSHVSGDLPKYSNWWNMEFRSVNTQLHLPPGYQLLAISGVDYSTGTWIARWNLLSMFLALVLIILVFKRYGVIASGVALVLVVSAYHEGKFNAVLWIVIVGVISLESILQTGRFKKLLTWLRNLLLFIGLSMSVVFVATQVRLILYPQLEKHQAYPVDTMNREVRMRKPLSFAAPMKMAELSGLDSMQSESDGMRVVGARIMRDDYIEKYDARAKIQLAKNRPHWRWHDYTFGWQSLVDRETEMTLYIIPSWGGKIIRFLSIISLIMFVAIVLLPLFSSLKLPRLLKKIHSLVLVSLSIGMIAVSSNALADIPDNVMLNELRARLLKPDHCMSQCSLIQSMDIKVGEGRLDVSMLIHNSYESFVALPNLGELPFQIKSVQVDGKPNPWVMRYQDILTVPVESGIHNVTLQYRYLSTDLLNINFSVKPKSVQVTAEDWTVSGMIDGQLTSDGLEFVKKVVQEQQDKQLASKIDRINPYIKVNRSFVFAVDWNVHASVTRIAPQEGTIHVRIPLVPGESVISPDIEVEQGHVIADIMQGEGFDWGGTLSMTGSLQLTAPSLSDRVEEWSFYTSPVWHIELEGIPIYKVSSHGDITPTYLPLPGETLTVSITRPESVPGNTLLVNDVSLDVAPGQRGSELTLKFKYQSTLANDHSINFPESMKLKSIRVSGREVFVPFTSGQLTLGIDPGEHDVVIVGEIPKGESFNYALPAIDLGVDASNIRIQYRNPSRWLLYAKGPLVGPAVLIWGEIVVFILLAFVLGRLLDTPLTVAHWLLLGLGLSMQQWGILLLFIVWVVAFWRRNKLIIDDWSEVKFNFLQLFLLAITAVTLLALISSIPMSLLGSPEMHIVGNASNASQLNWFVDYSKGAFPSIQIYSLPYWSYKVIMLMWALWLGMSSIKWGQWAWNSYSQGGYWLRKRIIERPDAEHK